MKLRWLAVILFLCSVPVYAQEGEPQTQFDPAFREKMLEAIKAFREKDFTASLEAINEAESLQTPNTATFNLRGAISLERGEYEAARQMFDKALTLDPDFYPAKFNLGEIPFQKKEYAASRAIYEKLLQENPKDELAEYKIFLTHLLEGNEAKAKAIMDDMKFPSNTPGYYFARAAWEYSHEQVKEAESWIQSSMRIFRPEQNMIFAETLEDLGWLKRPGQPQATPGS